METLGVFDDVDTAAKAVDNLVKAGFAEADITSLSSVPYPDGVLVKSSQRTWLRWAALGGGIFGAGAGFLLAAGTAWLYPVQTGDKPIVTLYPTGIIVYELMMLFAILGTVGGMFLEMRLLPWKERPYDPEISEGRIGISVFALESGECQRAAAIMQENGAQRTIVEASTTIETSTKSQASNDK